MTTKLGIPIADFETQLATQLDPGGTTATLQSATDDDAVALPAGKYFFTLDLANSVKEHIVCDLSGTALTNIKSISRQGVQTTGAARKHRIGASVTITDWAHIKYMNDLLDGTTQFNASIPLAYDGVATLTPGSNQFCTVVYADSLAIAGSPDATTTQKGITKMSVAPVSAASPIAVGQNDPVVPTQGENDALLGNNTDIAVGTGNTFVTQTGLQHNAEKYAADAGANDTYVITLSPVPTSYTNGMVVYFKANTANTGAATLNVNSLGAKTIVKGVSTTLLNGDIAAGMYCTVIYDGTNFVLQNPTNLTATQTPHGNYISTVAFTCSAAYPSASSTTANVTIPVGANSAFITYSGSATSNGSNAGGIQSTTFWTTDAASFSIKDIIGYNSTVMYITISKSTTLDIVFTMSSSPANNGGASGGGNVYFYS